MRLTTALGRNLIGDYGNLFLYLGYLNQERKYYHRVVGKPSAYFRKEGSRKHISKVTIHAQMPMYRQKGWSKVGVYNV